MQLRIATMSDYRLPPRRVLKVVNLLRQNPFATKPLTEGHDGLQEKQGKQQQLIMSRDQHYRNDRYADHEGRSRQDSYNAHWREHFSDERRGRGYERRDERGGYEQRGRDQHHDDNYSSGYHGRYDSNRAYGSSSQRDRDDDYRPRSSRRDFSPSPPRRRTRSRSPSQGHYAHVPGHSSHHEPYPTDPYPYPASSFPPPQPPYPPPDSLSAHSPSPHTGHHSTLALLEPGVPSNYVQHQNQPVPSHYEQHTSSAPRPPPPPFPPHQPAVVKTEHTGGVKVEAAYHPGYDHYTAARPPLPHNNNTNTNNAPLLPTPEPYASHPPSGYASHHPPSSSDHHRDYQPSSAAPYSHSPHRGGAPSSGRPGYPDHHGRPPHPQHMQNGNRGYPGRPPRRPPHNPESTWRGPAIARFCAHAWSRGYCHDLNCADKHQIKGWTQDIAEEASKNSGEVPPNVCPDFWHRRRCSKNDCRFPHFQPDNYKTQGSEILCWYVKSHGFCSRKTCPFVHKKEGKEVIIQPASEPTPAGTCASYWKLGACSEANCSRWHYRPNNYQQGNPNQSARPAPVQLVPLAYCNMVLHRGYCDKKGCGFAHQIKGWTKEIGDGIAAEGKERSKDAPHAVCYYFWLRGNCTKPSCKYQHFQASNVPGGSTALSTCPAAANEGKCTKADCGLKHFASDLTPTDLPGPPGVCYHFWFKGSCTRLLCPLQHRRPSRTDQATSTSTTPDATAPAPNTPAPNTPAPSPSSAPLLPSASPSAPSGPLLPLTAQPPAPV
eukprot:g43981.t1